MHAVVAPIPALHHQKLIIHSWYNELHKNEWHNPQIALNTIPIPDPLMDDAIQLLECFSRVFPELTSQTPKSLCCRGERSVFKRE